jgi:Baseplate J-like protein
VSAATHGSCGCGCGSDCGRGDGCGGGCGGGCCEGTRVQTPASVANRPGLPALGYRVGTHASFLASMRARLSDLAVRPPGATDGAPAVMPLRSLHARDPADPAIALLDAWATIADVLTFYQERIANEGYLRTATERRSVAELAALVGYRPRPGVAASVLLAFTLDAAYRGNVPAGTRARSLPAPGEQSQAFETSTALAARAEWNTIRPRRTRPQRVTHDTLTAGGPLHLAGTQTRLKPNDPLLVRVGIEAPRLYRVLRADADAAGSRTTVAVEPWVTDRPEPDPGRLPAPPAAVAAARQAVERDLDPARRGIDPGGVIAQRVVEVLRGFLAQLDDGPTVAELRDATAALLALLGRESVTAGRLPQPARQRHVAWLAGLTGALERLSEPGGPTAAFAGAAQLVGSLSRPPSVPTPPLALARDPRRNFASASDALPRALTLLRPALGPVLYGAWQDLPLTPAQSIEVHALRVRASLFGHNAPPRAAELLRLVAREAGPPNLRVDLTLTIGASTTTIAVPLPPGPAAGTQRQTVGFPEAAETVVIELTEAGGPTIRYHLHVTLRRRGIQLDVRVPRHSGQPVQASTTGTTPTTVEVTEATVTTVTLVGESAAEPTPDEQPDVVSLDAPYPQVLPDGWLALHGPGLSGDGDPLIRQLKAVHDATRADYGVTARGTQATLYRDWLPDGFTFAQLRGTAVLAGSEPLDLAEAPIDPLAEPVAGHEIVLDGLYDSLEPGRTLIVAGERSDIPAPDPATAPGPGPGGGQQGRASGVHAAEPATIAGVEQLVDPALPADRPHTVMRLATDLAYRYRLDTAVIYGNVSDATNGETRAEVLGSGDGSAARQRFALRQSPLTYVPAGDTPTGAASSLQVHVNSLRWHETDDPDAQGPTDHAYATSTADDGSTTVEFGDGQHGARLPTGVENVTATYRTGIGRAGNVGAGRVTLLATRPLGVKEVTNPLPAGGGADRDGPDQTRRNAPLAVTALDRLVSVHDYEDFARTFAGIGKASAVRLSDSLAEVIHVTVAGAGSAPLPPGADLLASLTHALHRFGDPYLSVQVAEREPLLLVLAAGVGVAPDAEWATVEPQVRAALLAAFGFDARELAQDVLLGEVLAAIQAVEGVAFADVDALAALDEATALLALQDPRAFLAKLRPERRLRVLPARLDRAATDPARRIQPAQLAAFDPGLPDTLILTERR